MELTKPRRGEQKVLFPWGEAEYDSLGVKDVRVASESLSWS